jgi:hypothetical protein
MFMQEDKYLEIEEISQPRQLHVHDLAFAEGRHAMHVDPSHIS